MKFEIEANTERGISEQVIKYAATLVDINKYLVDGFLKSDSKFKLIKKLPVGIFSLNFDNFMLNRSQVSLNLHRSADLAKLETSCQWIT